MESQSHNNKLNKTFYSSSHNKKKIYPYKTTTEHSNQKYIKFSHDFNIMSSPGFGYDYCFCFLLCFYC